MGTELQQQQVMKVKLQQEEVKGLDGSQPGSENTSANLETVDVANIVGINLNSEEETNSNKSVSDPLNQQF